MHLTHQALNNNGQLNAIYKGPLYSSNQTRRIHVLSMSPNLCPPPNLSHTISSTKEPTNSTINENNNHCTPNTPPPSPTSYLLYNTLASSSSPWYTSGHTHTLHLLNLEGNQQFKETVSQIAQSQHHQPLQTHQQLGGITCLTCINMWNPNTAHQPLSIFLGMMLILKK